MDSDSSDVDRKTAPKTPRKKKLDGQLASKRRAFLKKARREIEYLFQSSTDDELTDSSADERLKDALDE